MTNINMINELNNNSIFPAANGKKKQLPDSIINSKTDIGRIPGLYKNDDGYRPYTIYSGEFCPQTQTLLLVFWILLLFAWFLLPSWKLAWRNFFLKFTLTLNSSRVSCWRLTVSKQKVQKTMTMTAGNKCIKLVFPLFYRFIMKHWNMRIDMYVVGSDSNANHWFEFYTIFVFFLLLWLTFLRHLVHPSNIKACLVKSYRYAFKWEVFTSW